MAARLALLLLATTATVIQAQGNSACAQWCKDNFPARLGCSCASLAARGAGPCYDCGPPASKSHPEKKLCGGVCIDTSADNANCGACGTACSPDQTCTNGACVDNPPVCTSPSVLCGGACIDTSADSANCGACGNSCSPDQTCTNGACVDNNACTNPFVCGSFPTSCGNGSSDTDCLCFATPTPGVNVCLDSWSLGACSSAPCTTNDDCSEDRICVSTCCGWTCGLKAATCPNAAVPTKLFRRASVDDIRATSSWLNKHTSS